MKSEILVSFLLTDFEIASEEVTCLLGIIPSKTWKLGDVINPRSTLLRKTNGWQLKSSLDSC
jgi:hypothetical protein